MTSTAMTDTERALRLAVAANPFEQTPRDMLRDYWQETGWDVRVEFVRVQEEIAELTAPLPADPDAAVIDMYLDPDSRADQELKRRLHALRVREKVILDEHLPKFRDVPCDRCGGRRWVGWRSWEEGDGVGSTTEWCRYCTMPEVSFARGHVSTAVVTPTDFERTHNEPCPRCGGTGTFAHVSYHGRTGEVYDCPWCQGRRVVDSWRPSAPLLNAFAWHPVTAVRAPLFHTHAYMGGDYAWHRSTALSVFNPFNGDLPDPVFDLLQPDRRINTQTIVYPTSVDAYTALSGAVCRWVRGWVRQLNWAAPKETPA